VARSKVDRKGQPYYTRRDAAHRTHGWWGGVYRGSGAGRL